MKHNRNKIRGNLTEKILSSTMENKSIHKERNSTTSGVESVIVQTRERSPTSGAYMADPHWALPTTYICLVSCVNMKTRCSLPRHLEELRATNWHYS
jgi:hypothetical protein